MSLLLSILLATHTTPAAAAIDESALATPPTLAHAEATERGLIDAVRTVLDEQLSPGDRRRFGKKVLSASRVAIVEGSFPQSGALLVTVNVELRRPDPAAEPLFISSAFTLDASGELATVLVPPKMGRERHDLESIGDVDGDGNLDAVLTVGAPDSATRHLFTWGSGVPTDRVLAPADFEGC